MKWMKRIAMVLAVLLIVPMAALLILGHRANAGRVMAAAEIDAPPDQLWTWIDDGDKLQRWVSWLVEVKYPDPGKAHGAGASRILVMRDENNGGMLIQIIGKCSEYAPPSRVTLQLADTEGMFHGEETYQLMDLGNGRTRVEIQGRFSLLRVVCQLDGAPDHAAGGKEDGGGYGSLEIAGGEPCGTARGRAPQPDEVEGSEFPPTCPFLGGVS